MAANVALPGYRVFMCAGITGSTHTAAPSYSTSNYTSIADVRDARGPSIQRDVIDVTHYDSPNLFREFLFGMVDPGEITFDINWNPGVATHSGTTSNPEGVFRDFYNTAQRYWSLKFHGGTNWATSTTVTTQVLQFKGNVTGFDGTIPLGDKQAATVTIKINGEFTWTTG